MERESISGVVSPSEAGGAESRRAPEAELLRRLTAAVAAFDRGACPEEATGELTPDLFEQLPQGALRRAVRPMFVHLSADPPRPDRESAVRDALCAADTALTRKSKTLAEQ